jgi:hypothetical protein
MAGGNNQDRYIVELPMIKDVDHNHWQTQLEQCFFFNNQIDLFDCYLTMMNNQVYINFNIRKELSRKYVDFVVNNLPKKKKDYKKRFFNTYKN